MDAALAHRLVAEPSALTAAMGQPDPDSLAAATALRRDFDPELATAALGQAALRHRARTKFGAAAEQMFLTPVGLEQATRPEVARWRAARLVAAGVRRVADLGCGLGSDARAFAEAGLEVLAVEADEATAVLAEANLADLPGVTVRHARAEEIELAADQVAFGDPARRRGAERSWRIEDFQPAWDFVTGLLQRSAGAMLKLGPGLPHRLIPDGVGAEWISHDGSAVEVTLTSAVLADPVRAAVLLPAGERIVASEVPLPVTGVGAYLLEPDPAVIRSGAVPALAAELGATRLADQIAYLSAEEPINSPFATAFEVLEVLPYKEKTLRSWVREHRIGTLEIKKRGLELDPAVLRRRLRPSGPERATLVLTPTPEGARALVVRRAG
ncbi:class I SAM-dependent methyltransferase [Enemella evansiae]|uniref:class I SAM-dependent methyltransferase n=1 Tax=Enemella evansiae TaxID=2016499 RepID=UPI0010EBDAA1|nr:class I SAM-dependent methyltransferase [Enemella evansiae]TDO87671.1 methyltransferase family protein [Enemella evansiae]